MRLGRHHTIPTSAAAAEAHRRCWLDSRTDRPRNDDDWRVRELFRRPFDRGATIKRWSQNRQPIEGDGLRAAVATLDEQYRQEFPRYDDIFALEGGQEHPPYGKR